MKVLVVAATKMEVEPFIRHFGLEMGSISFGEHRLTILISGVGMVATAFAMGKILAHHDFDLAINAGIAGSFAPSIGIGEVVLVAEDNFADMGAEDNERFISVDELGFGTSRIKPLHVALEDISLKPVRSITVNSVHGSERSIRSVLDRLAPQIETMEGAAFFYACNENNLPSMQLRSISNLVEPRNRANWNIPLAIKNLNDQLIKWVEAI